MRGKGCHVYAADPQWWQYHIDDFLKNSAATGWTQSTNWKPGQAEEYGLNVLHSRDEKGLSRDPEWLNRGGNSGYQAINLAYHLGAQKIVLLGYDMSHDNGKAHWFGNHPKGLINCGNYGTYVAAFRTINPQDYGLTIINASRRSALDAFVRQNLESVWAS